MNSIASPTQRAEIAVNILSSEGMDDRGSYSIFLLFPPSNRGQICALSTKCSVQWVPEVLSPFHQLPGVIPPLLQSTVVLNKEQNPLQFVSQQLTASPDKGVSSSSVILVRNIPRKANPDTLSLYAWLPLPRNMRYLVNSNNKQYYITLQ